MKRALAETVPGIPEAQSLRLRLVGAEAGSISALAVGIAMSRRHLHRLIDGKRSSDPTEIDVRMLHLIAHERQQTERRVRALRRLQKKMLAHIEHVAAAKVAYGKD